MKSKLRESLQSLNLDAILIPRSDSFLGEHYPPEKNQLKKTTNFSGSAGLALITADKAVLFVDSRYTEQAKIESDWTVFEVPTETTPSNWILENLKEKTIGYNPYRHAVNWVNLMEAKNIRLKEIPLKVWDTLFPREEVRLQPAFDYDLTYCGETTESKIQKIVSVLKEKNLDGYVFTSPDSVSYILNKRSLSVAEYPVIFDRLIVLSDGSYTLFPEDKSTLSGKKIGLDLNQTSMGLFHELRHYAQIINFPDIADEMKSVKNPVEQDNIRHACLFESTVICRFLAWVEENKDHISETDCDKKLKELRAENPLYKGDSFDTIAAVGKHAALAHYQANETSNVKVNSAPLLLVDTGGNYLNGTTDMTRTICIGSPTPIMKKRYTQVLKGHIAVATASVKSGDMPAELDKKAHSFLRADGVDFGHSTGHGIGMYLAVHEAPPTIHEYAKTPLKAGMLFSNEPAFYDATEEYGIRLENMILTLNGPNDTLILENLLWIPFDGRLIDFDMLTASEKEWLRYYHKAILDRIFPKLSQTEQHTLFPLLDFFL